MSTRRVLRVLDLFSGIGGFSLGCALAGGFETIGFVEINPFCRKVLTKHWPNVPIAKDIRDVDESTFRGPIDLMVGGFPCQPFSNAGKRRGTDDNRDLWPQMFRLVQAYRPTWILGENVVGFIDMALQRTITDLENAGYKVRVYIVPAVAVNAPHQRDRVWIVAHSDSQSQRTSALDSTSLDENRIDQESLSGGEYQSGELAGDGLYGDIARWKDSTPLWAGGSWACPEPAIRGLGDGVSRRVAESQISALGNAVVPQVVEQFARAIYFAECGGLYGG